MKGNNNANIVVLVELIGREVIISVVDIDRDGFVFFVLLCVGEEFVYL